MKIDLNTLTRRFLLGEQKQAPSIRGYTESIINILEFLNPRTNKESRQISVAQQHLQEIKRLNRKLEMKLSSFEEKIRGAQAAALGFENKIHMLEEKINILEEGKD